MIYREFHGINLSLLGFGTMRLPTLPGGEVDQELVNKMVRYAADHGINYYDTAYIYHNMRSEIVIGKALKQLPRESFYLATKYPGHQIADSYDPAGVFEDQLRKCGVDYFDFYLLHNVNEHSIHMYCDPKWGMVDYFVEQKRLGRIKYLGFSCHGMPDTLAAFLDKYGDVMDFCQIQLNYLDWTLQSADKKYELLTERGIPVWVMEPVRGGKLANLDETSTAKLRAFRPEASTASWAFRFLQGLPNVRMILSGMSNLEQMIDNVHTFESDQPLTPDERKTLLEIAEGLKNSLPCTACRYCCAGCPMGLDIPKLLSLYNSMRYAKDLTIKMIVGGLGADKGPDACVGCGQCAQVCPQSIDIPGALRSFAESLETLPDWAEICRQREEAARKLREETLEAN